MKREATLMFISLFLVTVYFSSFISISHQSDPTEPHDIANAIETLARDEDLKFQLRQAGLERAKAFSWEEAARKTILTYWEAA